MSEIKLVENIAYEEDICLGCHYLLGEMINCPRDAFGLVCNTPASAPNNNVIWVKTK